VDARLAELFEREFDPMVRLARVFLGSSPEVEDVIMSSFVVLADRIDRIERPGGYLRTIVVNECRRRLRDRRRRDRIYTERVVPLAATTTDGPEHQYLDDLFDHLNEREHTAIVLTYYLDLPHAETAELMGCRVGTVKSLVHRALRKLRTVVPT
jgi:RNA polymerase sigma factor (sigma-70 family)